MLGLAGAFLATRALRTMLFQVGIADPWTVGTVAAVLAVVTVVAADGPARRAGRVDPITALRGR